MVKAIRQSLNEHWQIVVADGQAELKGKIFRIGHLGFICEREVLTVLHALEQVLLDLDFPVQRDWTQTFRQTLRKF